MLSCLLAAFYQFALFFFYFFYFLFKGKPEWQKIGNAERCTTNNCCLHNPKVQTDTSSSANFNTAEHFQATDKNTNNIKTEVSWRGNKRTTTTTTTTTATTSNYQMSQKMNSYQQLSKQYANKMARTFQNLCNAFYSILERISTIIMHFIVWLYSIIYECLVRLGTSIKISGTPTGSIHNQKQFQKTIVETTSEKIQAELQQRNNQQEQQQQQQLLQQSFSTELLSSKIFYKQSIIQPIELHFRKQIHTNDFNKPTLGDPDVSVSVLPQAPLLPPVSLPAFKLSTSATNTKDVEKVPPKGGVAVLPLDIMAEAHARIKEREQKTQSQENNEMNTEWTVTSKRFIPVKWPASKIEDRLIVEDKANEDGESLKSARKNIVSRISRSSDQDAQFIFRAPTHHNILSNRLSDGNFLMGRSVFTPVREAEEMRDRVNQRMTETPSENFFGSRLNTPLDDFSTASRINTPFEATANSHITSYSSYPASRSRSQSRIRTVFSPPPINQIHSPRKDETGINMLRQRSRTVEPRLAEGTVRAFTR
ncbi:unnamed protein product [Cercopithifilaria johnstoni]|uniref:Uncharacterized protein n=1 Tax=Cercopithifilaria johnstoni TaxID=2874296 RepID=A0A8J2M004_9BILA|nr:unnamed protein product [Cercopithifilaria johnstoni]